MAEGDAIWVSYEGGGEKTVERAAALLTLAKTQERTLTPLLVVCAAVVLASALDRATRVALDFLLQCGPGGQLQLDQPDIDVDSVRSCLTERTLENRVRRLPEIISNGVLAIHHSNAHGKAIRQMIWYRNRLAHPTDSVVVTELAPPVVDEHGSWSLSIPANQNADDKWEALTLADGERFLRAVRSYFDEVINNVAARDGLKAGSLLSPSMRY